MSAFELNSLDNWQHLLKNNFLYFFCRVCDTWNKGFSDDLGFCVCILWVGGVKVCFGGFFSFCVSFLVGVRIMQKFLVEISHQSPCHHTIGNSFDQVFVVVIVFFTIFFQK